MTLGISPIGLGLGASTYGDYSNYMPSSMGMMGMGGYGSGYGVDGMTGMGLGTGMYGMGGLMNGLMEYQMYMNQMQNQLDLNNLNHTATMHAGMIDSQVQAHEDSLHGLVQKLLADGAVQSRIMTLYSKIREGDQKGVIQEYDKLKDRVYETFDKDIASKGISIGRADEARRIIETMYGQLVTSTAQDGKTHTLDGDINEYCDGAFMSGLVSGFKGQGNRVYREETINHIYGKRIDNYKTNQGQKMLGKYIGTTGSFFRDIGAGLALGAGTWGAGLSAATVITGLCGGSPIKNWNWKTLGKGFGIAGAIGMAAMVAWDVIKRIDNKSSNQQS